MEKASDKLGKRKKLDKYEEEHFPRVAEKYRSHRWDRVTLEAECDVNSKGRGLRTEAWPTCKNLVQLSVL